MSALDPSPVFATFWRFAAERQKIFLRRLNGAPAPWTDDAILGEFRFTNVFRASDRVSQYLIRDVIYSSHYSVADLAFRVLLFKTFNRIETWELLERELGSISLASFHPETAGALLSHERAAGRSVYSNAYIIPPISGQRAPKHAGHLRLAIDVAEGHLPDQICSTSNLEDLFRLLRRVPGWGDFLAYQFAVDLCYSPLVDHDEDEFVKAGPGALDGLSKVFPSLDLRQGPSVIRALTDEQERWFDQFGLTFGGLFGRRLHLIDVQNLFCEIGKYARVAYPEHPGVAGRTRIKQRFKASGALPPPFFPPKWRLRVPAQPIREFAAGRRDD